MDLLYPRICQVAYSAGGDVNYGNYETYNYYNDIDYIENTDYLEINNSDEDIELVWRYSSKKPSRADQKRPTLKKSYTTLETYTELPVTITPPVAAATTTTAPTTNTSTTQRFLLPRAQSRYTRTRGSDTLRNSPTSSASSQHYVVQQQDEANNILTLANRNSKLNASSAELLRTSRYNRQQSAMVQNSKSKSDYYLEYINLINNPSMHPKYLSEAIKYTASEKKRCEKFMRSTAGGGGGSNRLLHDIGFKNKLRNYDLHAATAAHKKPKRSEYLQKENEKLKNQQPIDGVNASDGLINRIKEREKIIPPAKLSSLQQPSPQRPQVIIRPKVRVAEPDPLREGTLDKRYPRLPKTNTISTIDSVDLESEERDLFYTDVDVITNNRRGGRSSQNNNSSRMAADRSPDIYTEIVKIPNRFDEMSDDDYHKLELDLGVKEIEERSRSSFGSDDDLDRERKVGFVTQQDEDGLNDDGGDTARPTGAGKERKRIVAFDANVEINDDDDEEYEIAFYAEENEIVMDREIVKRKKLTRDAAEELDAQLEEATVILGQAVQMGEVLVEKSKTPEVPEVEEPTEKYEIKMPMPDFTTRKESVTILKPSSKNVIRLAPTVEKRPAQQKPKRERIDVNSLRPKFTRRVQFDEEPEEEIEEEEIVYSDDWLAKWCIFKEGQCKKFEKIFDEYDYMNRDYINGENLVYALERALPLNNVKMTYLMRIMGLLDVDPFKYGANKRTFCVIAALGQRIQHLDDDWFKNLLPRLDIKSVEDKVFKVKQLWDFLVDKDIKRVRIDDLMIEMKAGGVTDEHVKYAQEKFLDKISFDLLDYLTYVPLFIHIHEKIIFDPFNKTDAI